MRTLDDYLHEVRMHLVASTTDKERFLEDLREHALQMLEDGHSESQVMEKLGPPGEIAREFMQDRKVRYAGFLERFVAFFLDMGLTSGAVTLIVFIIGGLPIVLTEPALFKEILTFGASESSVIHVNLFEAAFLGLFILSGTAVSLLYFPVSEHLWGWTLGKRVLGLKVIQDDGAPLSLGNAFIRRIPYYFDLLALDAVFIFFLDKKQRAFDRVAKTVVVRDGETHVLGIILMMVCFIICTAIGLVLFLMLAAMPEPAITFF